MDNLDSVLKKRGFLLLDGAIGTELDRRGFKLDKNMWSAKIIEKHPKGIYELHKDYLLCGADIITTCTYQVSFFSFKNNGLSEKICEESLRTSIRLAIKARDEIDGRKRFVAASVSCVGACLTYDGKAHEFIGKYVETMTKEEIRAFHRRRLEIIVSEEPDILLFETYPALKEILIVLEMIEEVFVKKNVSLPPILISFCCKNGKETCYGDSIQECVKEILKYNKIVYSIGLNCTKPKFVSSLICEIKSAIGKEKMNVHVHPNTGEDYDDVNKEFYWRKERDSPISFGDMCYQWYKNGATIIGGCCRVRVDDIKKVYETFQEKVIKN